jgi:serine/threonine-protein kinase
MRFWAELKKRRVFPWFGAYIAGGFLVLEGFDQLVGQGLLPGLAYKLALVFYLFGFPGTLILAWFHGEKGTQKPPAIEIWLQSMMLAAALAVCVFIVRNDMAARAVAEAAAESDLDPRRVAVLYFEDPSGSSELEYLADGLTEALIDKLAYVRALDLISRNGVAPYRDGAVSRDSIARALDAGSLIAGSVEQVGQRIRVTARLVDGASGADLQRASFELPAGDLLVISDSLSQDVSEFLRERLGEEVRLRERRAATSNPDAWAQVQRAERLRKAAEDQVEDDDIEAAFASFDRADSILALAETLDPAWPEPTVLRGQLAYRKGRLDLEHFEQWAEVAMGHAQRALELASNHGEALELKGTLEYATWLFERPPDPDEASRLLEQAKSDLEESTRVDPTLASAYSTLSHLYYQVEDIPAVVLAARRAYEEDAYLEFADAILWRLFNASLDLEQLPQAERWCAEGAERFPQNYRFASCQLLLMVTPSQTPDADRAWELAALTDSLVPQQWRAYEHVNGLLYVGGVLARAGESDSARSVLAQARALVTPEIDPENSLLSDEAYVLILLGDYDGAVDLLKRYVAANPGHFEDASSLSWWWRPLQGHPGFQELVGGR